MALDPVELVDGLTSTADVSKPEFVAYEKTRGAPRMESVEEVRDTDLSGRGAFILDGRLYLKNTQSTADDDGASVIRDFSGLRWFRVGLETILWLGDYDAGATYQIGDGVRVPTVGSFVSLSADNVGNQPEDNPLDWQLIAADGEAFTIDAVGNLADRPTYDAQPAGFAFLAQDTGDVYIKLSNVSGDWSVAIPFRGPQGDPAVVVTTSTTSLVIGTGAKVFAVDDADYQATLGQRLRAASDDGTKIMEGEVTVLALPNVTIDVDYTEGAGTHGDWNIGIAGARGSAATIAVGATNTVAPGSAAAVTNSGTPNAAIFNFDIPMGEPFDPDEVVDTFADKAAFNGSPKNFSVLVVADESLDGLSYLYFKQTATSGDWSAPIAFPGSGGGSANYDDADVLFVAACL